MQIDARKMLEDLFACPDERRRLLMFEYGRKLIERDRGMGYLPKGFGAAKNALEEECRRMAIEGA
jgi:hypothetical protein